MSQQPDALRLADAIDPFVRKHSPDHLTSTVAAAELRRLHSVNAQLLEALEGLKMRFPTGKHLHAAGWDQADIDEAVAAYDEARSVIAAAQGQA